MRTAILLRLLLRLVVLYSSNLGIANLTQEFKRMEKNLLSAQRDNEKLMKQVRACTTPTY